MLMTLATLRRKKNCKSVQAAILVHGPIVVPKLQERLQAFLGENQEMPDFRGTLDLMDRALESVYQDLEHADDVHLHEVANDRSLRRDRDGAAGKLKDVLVAISGTVDNTYGPFVAEEVLGLGIGLRALPDPIFDVGRRAMNVLAKPEFKFSGPSLKGVDLIAEDIRSEIDGPFKRLGSALKVLRIEKKKFEETLRLKRAADAEFDTVYSMVANWLKALFMASGEPELAKRIRPTIAQPAKSSDDEETVEVDDETGEERLAEPSDSGTSKSKESTSQAKPAEETPALRGGSGETRPEPAAQAA